MAPYFCPFEHKITVPFSYESHFFRTSVPALVTVNLMSMYRVADKSLARPGRKKVTATEDFDVHISYL
jgi:hypothetical protein